MHVWHQCKNAIYSPNFLWFRGCIDATSLHRCNLLHRCNFECCVSFCLIQTCKVEEIESGRDKTLNPNPQLMNNRIAPCALICEIICTCPPGLPLERVLDGGVGVALHRLRHRHCEQLRQRTSTTSSTSPWSHSWACVPRQRSSCTWRPETPDLRRDTWTLGSCWTWSTYCLKNFRVRTGGAQGNQYHFGIVWGLEVLNLNFQPNPTKDKFQYCTSSAGMPGGYGVKIVLCQIWLKIKIWDLQPTYINGMYSVS